jgi:hypothetical protein
MKKVSNDIFFMELCLICGEVEYYAELDI